MNSNTSYRAEFRRGILSVDRIKEGSNEITPVRVKRNYKSTKKAKKANNTLELVEKMNVNETNGSQNVDEMYVRDK